MEWVSFKYKFHQSLQVFITVNSTYNIIVLEYNYLIKQQPFSNLFTLDQKGSDTESYSCVDCQHQRFPLAAILHFLFCPSMSP